MPKLIVKNNTNHNVRRANKVFPKKSTKETFIRKSKIPVIDSCVSLEWEYADPLMAVDFANIEDYTARELKEFARRAEIKNYSTMLKDDLIKRLEIKKGIREYHPEENEEVKEDEVQDTES